MHRIAYATPLHISLNRFLIVLRVPSSKLRIVPLNIASSGITFGAEPEWNSHTEITAFSWQLRSRARIDVSDVTMVLAASKESTLSYGYAPWPPLPFTVTVKKQGWAIIASSGQYSNPRSSSGVLW